MMTIIEDTGQKVGYHDNVKDWCESHGVILRRQKLNVGDYQSPPRVAVDTKQGMMEVYSNVVHDHGRFKAECVRAMEDGIRLVILIEDEEITSMEEAKNWQNPLLEKYSAHIAYNKWLKDHGKKAPTKPPVLSSKLVGVMEAMSMKYGVEWQFCHPDDTGRVIYEILNE